MKRILNVSFIFSKELIFKSVDIGGYLIADWDYKF